VTMSGTQITFKSEYPIPTGVPIKLALEWPASLDNIIPLMLHVLGITAEPENGATTVNIKSYEFRIADLKYNPPRSIPSPRASFPKLGLQAAEVYVGNRRS
jgi:hypothetical protein